MLKVRVLSFILAFMTSCYGFNFDELDAYIIKAKGDWNPPGVAIAIIEDGKISHIKTYGMKSAVTGKSLTQDTVFPIASLTKAFSALLMLKLEEDGKLKLDDPVLKYLPDFKMASEAATHGMTIEKLFQHRSGLPGFAFDTLVETGWSEHEIYTKLDQINPVSTFDETFAYQNVFPGLFGRVSEKVTGEPLNTTFRREIFEPLGMHSASLGAYGSTPSDSFFKRQWARVKARFGNWTDQHFSRFNGNPEAIHGGNPALYCFPTSRGVNATIKDMASWLQFWMNEGQTVKGGRIVSPENLTKMISKLTHVGAPQGGRLFPKDRVSDIYYGMGWYVHNYTNLDKVISHMGGMTGVRSIIAYVPGKKVGMVLLSNLGGMRVNLMPEAIRSKFLDMVAGINDDRDWSSELRADLIGSHERMAQSRKSSRFKDPVSARPLSDYVGVYENKFYGQVEVVLEGTKLVLRYRKLRASLKHWNGDNFSFFANDFSRSYSVTDFADMVFGGSLHQKNTSICIVNLLYEGANAQFKKKAA